MKYSILLLFTLIFIGCEETKKTSYSMLKSEQVATQIKALEHPGKKLMETSCYVCHSPTASHDNRIAPPMIAIKKHYIDDATTKEEFVKSMQDWIKNPTKEKSKMFGAVKRFGVMPKQAFPEETVKQIAEYMFENNIDEPKWFKEHFNKKGNRKKQ
tara:strand:- start:1417 stop:1884 length:468 start_codon:yes stop_codon:yes gene_type:complete